MSDYPSKYTGPEIDDLLDEVNGPDSTPTNGSQHLVQSGGVKAALDEKAAQSDVSELSVKSTDHDNRLNTIEGKIPSTATSQNKLATHSEVVAIQEGLDDVYTKEQIDAKEDPVSQQLLEPYYRHLHG